MKNSFFDRFKTIIFMSIFFVMVGIIMSAGLYYTYSIKSVVERDGVLYVSTGDSEQQRAQALIDSGFLKDTSTLNRFARNLKLNKVHPGKYKLTKGMSYQSLLTKLARGHREAVNVTFNNIRDFKRLAAVVSKYIEPDSATLYHTFMADSIAKKYDFDKASFLGMFIPNTYQLYWESTPEQFIDRMHREYESFWSKNDRDQKRKALGYSRKQVSTLASIVYEETKLKKEMPIVAGVYVNRIKAGIPLQADPTVKFALGDPTLRRVLFKDLKVNSPYNTYLHRGLPPGVITMPPAVAVDGVLDYAKHKYYYFCASPNLDGTHKFSRNLSEHNRNAAAYSAALNKRKIYR